MDTVAHPEPERPLDKIGYRYFFWGNSSNRPNLRRYHANPVGCRIANSSMVHHDLTLFTEQEVWKGADGDEWAIRNGFWITVTPCGHCAEEEWDRILASRTKWDEDAACSDTMLPGFFPTRGMTQAVKDAALALCAVCPVREDCDGWAMELHRLTVGGIDGIHGGYGRADRDRRLREDK